MGLKLYYDLLSQPSRAVYIFLKQTKIPFESVITSLSKGAQLAPEYEKINPFKTVPIIEHNGFVLRESIAIVRYLSREFNIDPKWYPMNSRDQAKVDEYLEWQHLNTRLHCSTYFMVKFLKPWFTGKSPKPERIQELESKVNSCLDQIEDKWLRDRSFITGDKINVADIFAACEIEHLRMAGFNPRVDRPRIIAWLEKVAHETQPYYQEAHKLVDKIANNEGSDFPPGISKL